jgi:hypothetical protein
MESRKRGRAVALMLTLLFTPSFCLADPTPIVSLEQPPTTPSSNGLQVFGGLMSTRSLLSTLTFNLQRQDVHPAYDNYVDGLAYDHDFWRFGGVVGVGVEVGAADRFGHYAVCCDIKVYSSQLVNSGEVWAGPRLSYEGIVLFNQLWIGPSATMGLSAVTNSIGRERDRELTQHGDARLLFFFGPELAFSLRRHENIQLTLGVHHRSGANRLLGHLDEGYNANTFGLRFGF